MKRIVITAALIGTICFSFTACKSNDNATDDAEADDVAAHSDIIDWADDPTIGIVPAGIYKRVAIAKKDETYEEMLELNKIADKGILVVNEDGTATFELDGEITEYTYDRFCLYLAEDSEKKSGMPYVFIGGRLILNDGSTITQYLKSED